MCGINGILTRSLSCEDAISRVNRMNQRLVHRGPDDSGLWQSSDDTATWHDDGGIVLGHRRLAIQDLSEHGKQPMHSHGNRFVIAFNGEIYNFTDVADELRNLGHVFRGHSDTEVLLTAIEQWGLDTALAKFTGMFAFALWDKYEQQLTLCRDRLGEKPLYYGVVDNSLYFTSELTAIEAVVDKASLEIDTDALGCYLQFGYITAPRSIYRNIRKLPPGNLIRFSRGSNFAAQHEPEHYWSLQAVAEAGLANTFTDAHEAEYALQQCLHENIRRQLIADVNVGTFLSGGIDSTTVTAIAQQESRQRIRTFTIGFTEMEYDESAYAERIAQHLDTEHTTLTLSSQDILDTAPDIHQVYDEPFADSSQIPSYLVSRLAREHVTVCLSGDGGDELFAGYNRYIYTRSIWQRLSRIPSPVRSLAGKLLAAPSPAFWDQLYNKLPGTGDSYKRQKMVGLKLQKLAGLLQMDDIHQAYIYLMSYWHRPAQLLDQDISSCEPGFPDASFIDQAMYADQSHYLPGDNLVKTDRASMATSLETRLPLLSHEIVELAWRIPAEMKVNNGVSKQILRNILFKSVPKDMIERPKMGFSVPVARWLRDDLNAWAGDMLHSQLLRDSHLDSNQVLQAWHQHQKGTHDRSSRLWTVLMYLGWLQQRN